LILFLGGIIDIDKVGYSLYRGREWLLGRKGYEKEEGNGVVP
jgi:hypothetical protein